jgi:O-antigen/teichoic acid export membrane protein
MHGKLRSLATDTIVYGVSTVAGRFLTFLLTPLYTNYLSREEIGNVSAVYAMIAFVNIAYSCGMEPAFMRFWNTEESKDSPHNKQIFWISWLSVAAVSLIITGVTIIAAEPIASSRFLQLGEGGWRLVAIASLVPLFDGLVLMPFARLRMTKNSKQFATMRFVAIVINVALNVLFVVMWDWNIDGVLWAGVLSSGATILVFVPGILNSRTQFSVQRLRELLRFGLPTVPASFSSIMVQVADRPIMLLLTSSAVVGLYQTNFRLALPMMMVVTVFEYAFKPFYLSHRTDSTLPQLLRTIATAFTGVCAVVFLISCSTIPWIVTIPFVGGRFVNPNFYEGMSIIPIVMFAYFWNGLFTNAAAGFHLEKQTGWFPLATGIAAAVNAVGTWLLVPVMGIDGAAWAKVIAYATSFVLLLVLLPAPFRKQFDWGAILLIVAVTAALYFVAVKRVFV